MGAKFERRQRRDGKPKWGVWEQVEGDFTDLFEGHGHVLRWIVTDLDGNRWQRIDIIDGDGDLWEYRLRTGE